MSDPKAEGRHTTRKSARTTDLLAALETGELVEER